MYYIHASFIAYFFLDILCYSHVDSVVFEFTLNSNWLLQNDSSNATIKGAVPGGVYTDLLNAGQINDPYLEYGDSDYKWIGRENWTYSTSFSVPKEFPKNNQTNLVFHGLDTVAAITLNGELIGNASNMFVRHSFDVSSILQYNAINNLTVAFESALSYAARQKQLYESTHGYNVPSNCHPESYYRECSVNFVRKMQSSFGWDQGPSFPSQGIWKPITLETFNTTILRDVTVFTSVLYKNWTRFWTLTAKVYFEGALNNRTLHGTLKLHLDDTILLLNKSVTLNFSESNEASINVSVDIPQEYPIEFWWPNGYGQQRLYNLTVNFTSDADKEITSKSLRIGFRTIKLLQQDVKPKGATFLLAINDLPIFAKGANWIPPDSFPERITLDHLKKLLTSAHDVNMNMLRVWGGGIYESDEFYALADELGILIWQDLMFYQSLYPVDDDFISTVSIEVQQQVRRLQHHPSLVLWVGNTESEMLLNENTNLLNPTKSRQDYFELFVNTLPSIIQKEDPSRTYVITTPSNGKETEKDGGISKNPESELFGDVHLHYDNDKEDTWNWLMYGSPRFASEYGLQSLPSFESLRNISNQSDWEKYPFNQFLKHRDHNTNDYFTLCNQISKHLALPKLGCKASNETFKDFIYLTQISQAMAVKASTEHFRRSKGLKHSNGTGYTMGALYFQLNDVWQTPSFSSLEYNGHWKILHYYAQNFFAPLLASPYLHENQLKIMLISDELMARKDLMLMVTVYHWESFIPHIFNVSISFVPPLSSMEIFKGHLKEILAEANCKTHDHCFISTQLRHSSSGKIIGSPNFVLLGSLTNAIGLQKANLTVSEVTVVREDREYNIALSSDAIAPFVWLDVKGHHGQGHFSQNGFIMTQPSLNVTYFSDVPVSNLKSLLTITSLGDVCSDKAAKCMLH